MSNNFDERKLLHMNEKEAQKLCEDNDLAMRVVQRDGVNSYVTAEYCSSRINVFVKSGKVSMIYSWG